MSVWQNDEIQILRLIIISPRTSMYKSQQRKMNETTSSIRWLSICTWIKSPTSNCLSVAESRSYLCWMICPLACPRHNYVQKACTFICVVLYIRNFFVWSEVVLINLSFGIKLSPSAKTGEPNLCRINSPVISLLTALVAKIDFCCMCLKCAVYACYGDFF